VRRVLAPDGSVVQDFQPQLLHTLDVSPDVLQTMRLAARAVVTTRHTFNLVDEPLVIAGKTGTAEFGVRDALGRLPFHTWFVAFIPNFTADQPGDPAKHGLSARDRGVCLRLQHEGQCGNRDS